MATTSPSLTRGLSPSLYPETYQSRAERPANQGQIASTSLDLIENLVTSAKRRKAVLQEASPIAMVVAGCDELDHTEVVHKQFRIGRLTRSVEGADFAKKSPQGRINYWRARSDGRRDLGQLTGSRIPLHPEVVEAVREVESFGTAMTAINEMPYALQGEPCGALVLEDSELHYGFCLGSASSDRIREWNNAKVHSYGHPMPNVLGIGPETAVESQPDVTAALACIVANAQTQLVRGFRPGKEVK